MDVGSKQGAGRGLRRQLQEAGVETWYLRPVERLEMAHILNVELADIADAL